MYKMYSSNIYTRTVYDTPMCYKVCKYMYIRIQKLMFFVGLFQQMCLEQDQLLAVSSNVLFSPMDIKMDATPLTGCVLSVRCVVYRISHCGTIRSRGGSILRIIRGYLNPTNLHPWPKQTLREFSYWNWNWYIHEITSPWINKKNPIH